MCMLLKWSAVNLLWTLCSFIVIYSKFTWMHHWASVSILSIHFLCSVHGCASGIKGSLSNGFHCHCEISVSMCCQDIVVCVCVCVCKWQSQSFIVSIFRDGKMPQQLSCLSTSDTSSNLWHDTTIPLILLRFSIHSIIIIHFLPIIECYCVH